MQLFQHAIYGNAMHYERQVQNEYKVHAGGTGGRESDAVGRWWSFGLWTFLNSRLAYITLQSDILLCWNLPL